MQGMRDGEGKGRQPDKTTTDDRRTMDPIPLGWRGSGLEGGKTGRANAGGRKANILWWSGQCLGEQGGAVVFLVAVLIR